MDHREGADKTGDVRLDFDRRVRLEFHGSKISSNGGLLLFRELDWVFRGIRLKSAWSSLPVPFWRFQGVKTCFVWLIPTVIDQNPCAHLRMPRDMIFHGWSMRLFQAWQHSATMSS